MTNKQKKKLLYLLNKELIEIEIFIQSQRMYLNLNEKHLKVLSYTKEQAYKEINRLSKEQTTIKEIIWRLENE